MGRVPSFEGFFCGIDFFSIDGNDFFGGGENGEESVFYVGIGDGRTSG